MIGPFKPKVGTMIGKLPSYAESPGESGDMLNDGLEFAVSRLIEAIKASDTKTATAALKNFMALCESAEDESEED